MTARHAVLGAAVLGLVAVVGVGVLATNPAPHTFQSDDFTFTYPAAWREISGYEHAGLHGPTLFAAVGIGDFDLGCSSSSTSVSCGSTHWTVPEDGVVVAYHLGAWLGPRRPQPSPALEAGEAWVMVGGRQVAFRESDRSVSWRLPGAPELIEARWGPANATARSQIEAVIASWAWATPDPT